MPVYCCSRRASSSSVKKRRSPNSGGRCSGTPVRCPIGHMPRRSGSPHSVIGCCQSEAAVCTAAPSSDCGEQAAKAHAASAYDDEVRVFMRDLLERVWLGLRSELSNSGTARLNEWPLRRLARTGPVAARDEEEGAFETSRLEDSLHFLADGAADVLDAAAVERAHDGRRRQLEGRAVLRIHGLAQPGVREIHVSVQVVFARRVRQIENTEDESRHGSPIQNLEPYSTLARVSTAGECKNCGAPLAGRYCSACGQSAEVRIPSLGTLFLDVLGDVFSFDSRIWHSLATLALKPGRLTSAY